MNFVGNEQPSAADINSAYIAASIGRDPDGETYHGIARYRAVTEPNP